MMKWARFKKLFLLLAVSAMLLISWPTQTLSVEPPPLLTPRKSIPVKQPQPPANNSTPSAQALKNQENVNQVFNESVASIQDIQYEENYYDIYVNGVQVEPSVFVLKDKSGDMWIPLETLKKANFIIDDLKPLKYSGETFVNLGRYAGVTYKTNDIMLTLNITSPLAVFKPQNLDFGGSKIVDPTIPPWGAYLNYNITTTNQSNQTNASGLFGLNVFGPYGYGNATFSYTTAKVIRPFVRLFTTWVIDNPDNMTSVSIGDNVSVPTNWSGSFNYGGFQYARNFKTQPAFYTFPLPGYSGAAIRPSTIDMFVNNALAKQQNIQAGAFDISNIPMVDGEGNVVVFIRDPLGNNQVYKATYYISTMLLKKGLSDYSLDVGIIRDELGTRSNVYSQGLLSLTYGYGLTEATTGEIHGQAYSFAQAAGLTLTHLFGKFGVVTGSVAGARNHYTGNGALASLAYQYQGSAIALGGSARYTTANYSETGQDPTAVTPKLIAQVFTSFPVFNNTVSINWLRQLNRGDTPSSNVLTGSYSGTLWKAISIALTVVNSLSGPKNKSAFLSMTYSFDQDTSISGSHSNANDVIQNQLQLQRNLPPGPGYGYDITLNEGAQDSKIGSFSYQNDIGTYQFNAIKTEGNSGASTYSLNVKGGFVYMDHFFKMSREITNSFGLIKTGGFEGIDIYSQNQLIGKTDKSGVTFVPNLLAYQPTVVYLDSNTVPLDAQIDSYTTTVIPYKNSGVLIPFTIKKVTNATITLKLENGEFAPEGSIIHVKDNELPFLVGMEGVAFMTGISGTIEAEVTMLNGYCSFSLKVPEPNKKDPLPDLGTITCKKIDKLTFSASKEEADAPAAPVATGVTNPVTSGPATPAPVIENSPATSTPEASSPAASAPVNSLPATSTPVSSVPVTSAPVPSQPVKSEPVTSAPVAPEQKVTSHYQTNEAAGYLYKSIQQGLNRAIAEAVSSGYHIDKLIEPENVSVKNNVPIKHNRVVEVILKSHLEGVHHAIQNAVLNATV